MTAAPSPRVPCVCDSRKVFEKCCLPALLHETKPGVDLSPPLPATGFSRPGCYMSSTHDCDDVPSQEHYVSECALRHVDDVVQVSGFPWLKEGEKRRIPIPALTAGVLCERHNAALSPLDTIGGEMIGAIREFAFSDTQARRRTVVLNGRDVERWMLKCLFGLVASRNLQSSQGEMVDTEITHRCVELLHDDVPFETGRGFYIRTDYPSAVQAVSEISVSPLINPSKATLQGLTMSIMGLDFLASTCPISVDGGHFRPSVICFCRPHSTRAIKLHWDQPGAEPVVYLYHRQLFPDE